MLRRTCDGPDGCEEGRGGKVGEEVLVIEMLCHLKTRSTGTDICGMTVWRTLIN